jgi:DNA topoisomerase-1
VPSVGGVFVPKNPAFEAMHPRDKSGRDRGQFIDVPGVMAGLGAMFDHERGVWNVPSDRVEDLKQMGRDTGFKMMSVPKGMRPLRSRGALASAVDETGAPDPNIAEDAQLEKKYGIPPAWTDVMVSDDPNVEVLAVGRDEKGRKQTVRNQAFQAQRRADNFARIARLHDKIGGVDHRLSEEAHDDDTAAAMMVVRKMGLRPGSTKDTKADQYAYGASTLERRHVALDGDTVRLEFDSKKGGHTVLERHDPELASVLRVRMAGKAGDDQMFPKANDRKMNRWVDDTAGEEFKVKDFRTYLGTSTAAALVAEMPEPLTAKEHQKMRLKVGDRVSAILGNTRQESLKSYIDPAVFPAVPGDGDADMVQTGLPEPTIREIPGEAGRAALKDAFDAGFTEHEELTGGVSSLSVKRVTLSDGTTGVLKRPKPEQHRTEITAAITANALGFDAVHTIDAGDGRLLTNMVDGRPGGKKAPIEDLMAHVEDPGGREMAVLDWVIRNRDRHGGNWIVNADGVHPIDHGLANLGPEDADRDIPRGVFAQHWLGLTQKPTAYAAQGKTRAEARNVKGPKAKLEPKFSKRYLEDVRDSLEQGRDEYTDEEWAGIDARLRLLEDAAPDSIPGEKPFKGSLVPETATDAPSGDWQSLVGKKVTATHEDRSEKVTGTLKTTRAGLPFVNRDDGGSSFVDPTTIKSVDGTEAAPPGGFKVGDRVVYDRPGFPKRHGKVVGRGRPKQDGTPTVAVVYDDDPRTTWQLDPKSLSTTDTVALGDKTVAMKSASQPKPPKPSSPDAPSKPGARHSLPNGQYVSPIIEQHVAAADIALKDSGVDLAAVFTRPDTKIGRHAKANYGTFKPSTGRIDVNPDGKRPIVTVLHELGHKLDWEANGRAGSYGSEAGDGGAMGPGWDAYKEMRAGVARYEAQGWTYIGQRGKWATLRRGGEEVSLDWAGNPLTTQHGQGGREDALPDLTAAKMPDPPDTAFMDVASKTKAVQSLENHPDRKTSYGKYMLKPREVFARAFAQYVASQAKDRESIYAWLREQQVATTGSWQQQWTDEDFAELHVYFDGLMTKLGAKV